MTIMLRIVAGNLNNFVFYQIFIAASLRFTPNLN